MDITDNGKYLYQLEGLNGSISAYRLNDDRSLTFIQEVEGLLPEIDTQGLVTYCAFDADAVILSFDQLRGNLVQGGLDAITESDDQFASFAPGFTLNPSEAPVWLEFEATVNEGVSELTIESNANTIGPVSYTHLTLPTICSV